MVEDKKINQDHILDLVKEFDVTFDTSVAGKVNSDAASIIKRIFVEYIEGIYSPSQEYNKLSKIAITSRKKLEQTMTLNQKELLEDYCEKETDVLGEVIEQAFVYGFCLANQLRDEIGHIYNINKKR